MLLGCVKSAINEKLELAHIYKKMGELVNEYLAGHGF